MFDNNLNGIVLGWFSLPAAIIFQMSFKPSWKFQVSSLVMVDHEVTEDIRVTERDLVDIKVNDSVQLISRKWTGLIRQHYQIFLQANAVTNDCGRCSNC